MIKRNRASGWQHAKLSGHENESRIDYLMANNSEYKNKFLEKVGKPSAKIVHIDTGGLHEKNVECIFEGETTKSKTDMHITLDDGSKYNVSIKKSLSGQVFLVGITRFIVGYEKQYKTTIPANVKRAISLFWGSASDTLDIIKNHGKSKTYESRKHRLVANTLLEYNQTLYDEMLNWFKGNIYNIVDFCFSKGLAKSENEWANVIWYKNELGENQVNDIFLIEELCEKMQNIANDETYYGTTREGTTIQLPFGFVQWHSPRKKIPGEIQFHHKYEKLIGICKKSVN